MEDNIWENEEFSDWVKDRPQKIQEVIKKCPPNKKYRLSNGHFPVYIYSYYEEEGGDVKLKVDVVSPFFPRRVFGVKPEDLKIWEEKYKEEVDIIYTVDFRVQVNYTLFSRKKYRQSDLKGELKNVKKVFNLKKMWNGASISGQENQTCRDYKRGKISFKGGQKLRCQ
jgi:hypothetical protein